MDLAQAQVIPQTKLIGSASDPLWYKDAVIYELHVKAFADANNDGIGDFQGLMGKLDYLQDLGVTCLWLLPFFPSPLRDDGYDIADYMDVHPSYGTIEDFRAFLDAAHERGLQVMIELVVNHTSDQHPWFQRARLAEPGSPERDWYVWSDSEEKYKEARIIFTDTEKSNWTWDPVAKAYFWHRFFSHQPDLNYDNPAVVEEVLKVMRFWLDMGVDGLRTDAIPYLVERDGTNCENLPETHAVIKEIRAAIDERYANRLILAEANQWPADVRPYFGDGDECHMAFHFPLMPRIYMALRQEDRMPITEIMAQTPEIPESCQWGLFLRNHDELTLEMVTDDERDYMYLAYSADPRMRINIGIRRRLAPLVDNNRRRIELLNSLLFSFPGTPIIYYGDEIGMGDNIYLGDRNGVRTPMQWNGDRNAGFSRAVPARLYSPVVMDPVWGYEAVNVEAQQEDPSSLLNWMRNMIALRKLFQVFGRGTLEFLNPTNRKVLAYIRRHGGELVLCVANLSRFAQPVELDLGEFEGMTPVEMLGYVEFPRIRKTPYPLSLAPYGFLWLELHSSAQEMVTASEAPERERELLLPTNWASLFSGEPARRLKQDILPEFLKKQRWFGSKAAVIVATHVTDWGEIPGVNAAIAMVTVDYESGRAENYVLPLAVAVGSEADALRESNAKATVTSAVTNSGEPALLYDGMHDAKVRSALLKLIESDQRIRLQDGELKGEASSIFQQVRGDTELSASRLSSAEQSNSSAIFGNKLIMKLFRRPEPGVNPDVEIGRYLTEKTSFDRIAPFGGAVQYVREVAGTRDETSETTVAMLQGLVENEGDGWKWTLEELERYYESCGTLQASDPSCVALARAHAGVYVAAAGLLGRRTGEMHVALASGAETGDDAFMAEPISERYWSELLAAVGAQCSRALTSLRGNLTGMPDESVEAAGLLLSMRTDLMQRIETSPIGSGKLTRIHGDYHLGQVLRSRADFVVLDFEGEPARPLEERRAKHSPLKDVAGMLRSFSYAGNAALLHHSTRRPSEFRKLLPWMRLWEEQVSAEYLKQYRGVMAGKGIVPEADDELRRMLDLYLLDKASYELLYELNNRPAWVRIPLEGIISLARAASGNGASTNGNHGRD